MAELPMREQDVYSWRAAAPGRGLKSPLQTGIGLCILTRGIHSTSYVSYLSPNIQGNIEKQVAMLPVGFYTEQNYCANGHPRIK